MNLELRDYQLETVEQAKEAIRGGAKNILICAPTGAGKTAIASHFIFKCKEKGNRANFVVDRLSLLSQSSEVFDGHGIDHGVVQSQHERFSPSKPVQVCSIQTVTRRSWPESALDVIDEAHVLHEAVKKRIKGRDRITLGLTATPFTKGLGKHFDAIINVTTTNKLIEQNWLSPYRIFSCAEPNMDGVKVTKLGEWDSGESEKRALEVVGDVVAEYLRHGEGRKFICSAVDTTHVEELQRQFLSAGINVASYTYKDDDEARAETVTEFRKSDSAIRGLITVTAASRGFDVPSVSCIIMARPLRKSLAEHIQFFGRGLRIAEGKKDCVARGTLVLTDCGEVPIEHVTLDHKVWDGEQFVNHAGTICRGVREVIEYDGLIATPDHEVMTDDGWTRFEEAARRQRRIARTGVDGRPLRFIDDLRADRAGQRAQPARRGGVRALLSAAFRTLSQHSQTAGHGGLPALQWAPAGAGPGVAVPALSSAVGPLPQSALGVFRAIRRAWDRVSVSVGQCGGALGRGESWSSRPRNATGPRREQRALRAGESPLDHADRQPEQHAGFGWPGALHCLSQGISWGALRGRHLDKNAADNDASRDSRALEGAFQQTQREVWDVLNAGPLQRFTANGRLVHNCVILDHSGNCARFWQDMNEFFEVGVTQLDDGKKKDKPKPKEKAEAEPVKCPSCRALHKPMPFCPACGHEYPKKRAIEHVPGTLKELIATGNQHMLRARLWPQIVGYVLERREGEQAQRMAQAIYKNMTGEFARARVETTTPAPCSYEVRQKIRAGQIRRSYAQRSQPAVAAA